MGIMKWDMAMTTEAREVLKALGANITTARKRRKLSAAALALRVGVDRRTIASLESGSPTVSIGALIQTLSILGLSRGLDEALSPDNDIAAISLELKRVRKGGRKKKTINDDEVGF